MRKTRTNQLAPYAHSLLPTTRISVWQHCLLEPHNRSQACVQASRQLEQTEQTVFKVSCPVRPDLLVHCADGISHHTAR